MKSLTIALLSVLILLIPPALTAQGPVYPHAVIIEGGVSYTLAAPTLEDLEYEGLGPDESRAVIAIWPVADVRIPIFDLGPSVLKLNIGIQPMFISTINRSQLNPNDTKHTDADYSAFLLAEYPFPILDGLDVSIGVGLRYHFWTYDYYYDSQVAADTSNSYSGSYFSLSMIAALDFLLGTIPFRIAVMPDFSYGVMLPVVASVGFPIGGGGK